MVVVRGGGSRVSVTCDGRRVSVVRHRFEAKVFLFTLVVTELKENLSMFRDEMTHLRLNDPVGMMFGD
jgi:hypothetical protein